MRQYQWIFGFKASDETAPRVMGRKDMPGSKAAYLVKLRFHLIGIRAHRLNERCDGNGIFTVLRDETAIHPSRDKRSISRQFAAMSGQTVFGWFRAVASGRVTGHDTRSTAAAVLYAEVPGGQTKLTYLIG
jgi:hypothetical protein